TWTYTASNSSAAIQSLGNGQTLTETFAVASVDGSATSNVTVTINGTNDIAVISAASGAVTEDSAVDGAGNLVTGGTVSISDVDAGQAAFVAQPGTAGAYGSFTLAADGTWTYTASNGSAAIQSLGNGQTLTETFAVASVDGSATSSVTVTINGTNDIAVISAASGAVTEDVAVDGAGNLVTGGTVAIADVDAGQASFVAQPGTAGAYGTFTLAADGTWTYTASNASPAIQALGNGQTLTETFAVASVDGSATSSVTVTINGTNDIAVVSAASGAVTEDSAVDGAGNLVTGGTVSISDVDAGQASFVAQPGTAGAYGSFTLAADGTWTYTASNASPAIQALGNGQTLTETFAVASVDGSATSSVTVTITGSNDAPVANADSQTVAEDNAATGNVLGNDSDVDTGAALAVTQFSVAGVAGSFAAGSTATIAGVGSLQIASDGSYSFTPLADYNGAVPVATYTVSDGTASTSATLSINVSAVNDAPTGTDKTITIDEDTSYTLSRADFGFADSADSPANNFAAVTLNASSAGTLRLNGTAIAASTTVTVAELDAGLLTFTPAANANRTGYASFSFAVKDDGGTASGGADTDATSNTITFNVTAVNDAPVNTIPVTVNAVEDALASVSGVSVGDPDQSTGPAAHRLVSVDLSVSNGSLLVSLAGGATVSSGSNGSATFTLSGTQIALNAALATLQYQGNANYNGPDTLVITSHDGAGASDTDTVPISVASVNDAPTGQDATRTIDENTPYTFASSDFGFQDAADGNNFLSVSVNPPSAGTLTLNGVTVSAATTVLATQIDAGALQFTPAAGASGNGYASLSFTVRDDGGTADGGVDTDPTPNTLSFDVVAVNDAPTGTDKTITLDEDTSYTLSGADFGFADSADSPANNFAAVTLDPSSAGTLRLNGTEIVASTTVTVAQLDAGLLTFTPAANANGSGYASFSFAVNDDGGTANGGADTDATPNTITFDVNAVNDAPSGQDATRTIDEDTPYTFARSDFGFQDAADGNNFLSVSVNPPSAGTLTLNGVTVSAATTVLATQLDTGALQFTPAANASGNGYASFTFTVRDDGGTANGGVDTDTASNTLTFNVTAISDAPVSVADSYSAVEGSITSLSGSVLANDTDVDSASLTVTQVAGSASGTAITADGVTTITTALGGTVVMSSDGTFRYIAPVRDHADAVADVDSFVYKASDGSAASAWTTVNISLTETTPIAVADTATVGFNSTVSGNLLFNDLGVDTPLRVTSVTYGSTTQAIASGGSTSFSTSSGQVVVSSDGSYTYTSQIGGTAVLTGSSKATWEVSTDLYGFTSGNAWKSGSSDLDLSALTSSAGDEAVFVTGSKNGIGVGSTGSGPIGKGEQLIVHLLETSNHASIGIAQLNSNQDPANAHWYAYDASGVLVDSGSFALATSTSNGAEYTLDITTTTNFAYFRLSWEPSGNNSQGFVLSSLSIDRLPGNHIDSFSYAMADEDNSTAASSLTVTPGSSSSTQSTSLTGTAGNDHLNGDGNANAITGNGGNDILVGNGGNDTLTSGSGTDALHGGTGNDTLSAGGGNDILVGGAGNDSLSGGSGADVFAWSLSDKGSAGTPAVDTITDFDIASPAAGGDQLDLRDLLQGETTVGGTGNLGDYLHFSVAGGDTTIQISSAGGFSGGFQASAVDQTIVLQSVDLSSAGAFTTDQQIIQDLLNKSKLIVDAGA
ncbi:beta strand repeat-containing protein, partial [Piscinibacter sp.]|uniref:beta strand repeat-containing protein n=1 Tax=Piscinibacter sp. TaxID=1903157 RepID=UPI002F3FE5AA